MLATELRHQEWEKKCQQNLTNQQNKLEERQGGGPSTGFPLTSKGSVKVEQLIFAPLRLEQPMEFGGQLGESEEDWISGMNTFLDAAQCPVTSRVMLASTLLCSTALEWFNLRKLEDNTLVQDWA